MTLLKHPITFLLILAAACASAAESKQKLNVVVILADDLGWADLSCYGSTFHETPHLDELAREGMRFTQGIPNGKHALTIKTTEKRKPIGIRKFKIYRPRK